MRVSWFRIPRMVCDFQTPWCLKRRDCLAPLSHVISCYPPPPSRHCPAVSATHHRDMFKTFSSPNTTHWKIWGMLGPGVQGPPGSLNKINDISGKISFGVITRDALKWNLGANKNNCLFVMAHTNLTTDIIGKHFRMTCLFLLPSIFVNQIETQCT